MSTAFPKGFLEQLAPLLGDELPSFVASYEALPCRGLRMRAGFARPADAEEEVPWAENGYRVPLDTLDGATIAHEAGAYYMQEPSAMVAAAALHPTPGERVLDLCAAPGGKSTQLATYLQGQGLLVCNEPHPGRAQILSRNIERMGVPNAIVVSSLPEKMCGPWKGFFDKVLVDAPCSGEGMFRRHPESREEWDESAPARCAQRQKQILDCAAQMVRPGGMMAYSTCTFNALENEGVIADFLAHHADFALVPFALPGLAACDGQLRIWPHKVRGEGHFVALLCRQGEAALPIGEHLPAADKASAQAAAVWAQEVGVQLPGMVCAFGGQLVCPPVTMPPLKGIKVLRLGLHVGQMKGKAFVPDHAIALALKCARRVEVDEKAALAYMHGESLPCEDDLRGWITLVYQGMQLGWGKASDGQIKNHYPKGLRK